MAYLEQFKYCSDDDVVLEIGIGVGIFRDIVSKIAEYYAADVNADLNPDYIVDIAKQNELLQITRNFSKVFCCQVLEHMPFDAAIQGLQNILKLGADIVCISIPDNRRYLRMGMSLARFRFKKIFSLPFTGKRVDIQNHGAHHWEIYSGKLREVMKEIRKTADRTNYRISDNYRLYERPYQHFIIFERSEE